MSDETKIKAIADRVLVEPLQTGNTIKADDGSVLLHLPEQRRRDDVHLARVVSVGTRVRETISEGDIVCIIGCDAGTELDRGRFLVAEELILWVQEDDDGETPSNDDNGSGSADVRASGEQGANA